MAVRFGIPPAYIVGCVISSGLFGDQCSPISDTTVLSSTGGSCNHIVHVMTQIPYGVTVGVSALIGFLFGGLTGQFALSIAVTAVVLLIALFILKTIARKTSKADTAAAA
ncbi:MAG: Na+/H+ antiporter NhaC family protein, partial [Emergencia timonensis]